MSLLLNSLLIAQTGVDLSPIIGAGPIGAILALFIFMYREKDKHVAVREVEKDKAFIAILEAKDKKIEALQDKIDAMQAAQIDRQAAQVDRYHAALAAMTEATKSLSVSVEHATEVIVDESPRRLTAQVSPPKEKI